MAILWRGIDKKAGEIQLEKFFLPADPDATMKKDGSEWIIEAKAMMSSKPVIVEK